MTPRAEASWITHPFRLISLGGYVRQLLASGFVNHGNNLMLYASPGRVFAGWPRDMDIDRSLGREPNRLLLECLRVLQNDASGLGLRVTERQVTEVIDRVQRLDLSYRQVDAECTNLMSTLRAELDSRLVLAIDAEHVPYYESPLARWEPVTERFPSALVDVEEASKCFALNRYTATVFHLMRVMEHGLRAVGQTLGDQSIDPRQNPTWNRIIARCDAELRKPLAERSAEWRSDEAFFSGVAARMHAVKDAWRNPTMHVEITYTEEQASDIYQSVRGFMLHLATKVGEG